MWLLIVSALVVASAALEEDDYCQKPAYRVCETKPSSFPENEKEFDESCPIILEQFRCMQEHALKCETEMIQWYTAHYELLQDVCRKDSHLHEAIAKNIGCIKDSVTEGCSEKISTVVRAYADSLEGYEHLAEEDYKKVDCMYDAYAVTCAVDSASRQCDSILKATILEMARRVDFLDTTVGCPRTRRQEMVKDIPDMEISMEQKLLLEEILLEI